MVGLPLAALAVVVTLLAAEGDAIAAQPIAGGRYEGKWVALTISENGRGLSRHVQGRRGDYLEILSSAVRFPRCGGQAAAAVVIADAAVAAPFHVDGRGHFHLAERSR